MDDLVKFIKTIYLHEPQPQKTILELSTFNGFPMWWTSDILFYEFLSRTTEGIDKTDLAVNYYRFLNLYRFVGIYLELFYDIFLKVIIQIIDLILPATPEKKGKKICFIAQDRQWRLTQNYHTHKMEKTDVFFDPVLKHLDEYDLSGIYPIDLYPFRGIKVFLDKRKNWNINHNPVNKYWSFNSWKKQRKSLKKFKKSLEIIKKDESFKKACQYQEIDLYDNIIKELEVYFLILYPHLVKYLDMAQIMIEKENPDLILLLNEYAYWERSLLMAAKKKKIKTIALQHGVFYPGGRYYMYAPDEISANGDLKCPLPDYTIVYGSFYKDLLTQISSFPNNSVWDFGQPRYDILYHASNIYSKKTFRKEHKIPLENKIILWTTQFIILNKEENLANIQAIMKSVEEIENSTLIIKLHPLDTKNHEKMIKDISKNYKINFLIINDIETLELIYNSDIMITKNSTTALESIALNKPVIILNLSGEPDTVDYVQNKVALGVYEKEKLANAIETIFSDDLSDYREEYIKKYLHIIDGKSSLRISNFIKKII